MLDREELIEGKGKSGAIVEREKKKGYQGGEQRWENGE